MNSQFPLTRPRRLRMQSKLRSLVSETRLHPQDFIMPLFVHHGSNIKNEIPSMPGIFQFSLDNIVAEAKSIAALGIPAILLFGIPAHKDAMGSDSYSENGIIQQALKLLKKEVPEILCISDVCFCEYTDHGHCGVVDFTHEPQCEIDNDATLALLVQQAISHAKAGADIIAPSGMMDGTVAALRRGLDTAGFSHLPILSYSVKYASGLYGPFRDAALGVPQFGDRKSYQMDITNGKEALKEAALDSQEGADILMVKPAGWYLDVISQLKQQYPAIPLAAYQVSGEYAMIKAAASQGWLNEQQVILESLIAIKRAGADMIISYFAKEVAKYFNTENH
jgi:porphobilinogen synthase